MTLHWWMHWFWVTVQVTAVALASPTPSQAKDSIVVAPTLANNSSKNISLATQVLAEIQRNYRMAMSANTQVPTTSLTPAADHANDNETTLDPGAVINTAATLHNSEDIENNTVGPKKEAKSNKISVKPIGPNFLNSRSHEVEIMTVVPLQSVEEAKPKSLGNIESTDWSQNQINWTDTVTSESSATTASQLDGGQNDATRLGRARGAFGNELQRNQISGYNQPKNNNNKNSSNSITMKDAHDGNTSATEIAAITGSCLAMVILLSTAGSLGFIMYRRKYLNPPQTLNSDKCSNPDSSGYIDDSTIRENSEEMYSLDNDSFLNSLEAMTIQNYWTDSVKHTKL